MRTESSCGSTYGSTVPWVSRLEDGALRAIAGPDMVTLRTAVALHGRDLTTVGDFESPEGEIVPFVLTHAYSHLPPQRRSIRMPRFSRRSDSGTSGPRGTARTESGQTRSRDRW